MEITSKFAVVKEQAIWLYSKRPKYYPASETLLEDVTLQIENGILHMDYKVVKYFLNLDGAVRTKKIEATDKIKSEIVEGSTYVSKPNFIGRLLGVKEKEYVKGGFIEYKERVPRKKIMTNFELIFVD